MRLLHHRITVALLTIGLVAAVLPAAASAMYTAPEVAGLSQAVNHGASHTSTPAITSWSRLVNQVSNQTGNPVVVADPGVVAQQQANDARLICTPRAMPAYCRPIASLAANTASRPLAFNAAAIAAGGLAALVLIGTAVTLGVRRREQLLHP